MMSRWILPLALMLCLVGSWILKSNDGLKLSLIGFAVYGLFLLISGAITKLSQIKRRWELAQMPVFSANGTILTMSLADGTRQERPLDELLRILILTTDQGPFVCDLFLLLVFQDGTEWNIPAENPSHPVFYKALGRALPLNDEQSILASCSTVNGLFPLWETERIPHNTTGA